MMKPIYRSENLRSPSYLQTLLELGFEEAGVWELSESGLACSLTNHLTARNILYAFANQSEVLYIGKSVRTFAQRMYQYRKPGLTQRTNIANHAHIKHCLEQGEAVQIFIFVPEETLFYRGIAIGLAAGLEDALIQAIQPAWNQQGKSSC